MNYLKFYLDIEQARKLRKSHSESNSTDHFTESLSQQIKAMKVQDSVSEALHKNYTENQKIDNASIQSIFDRVHVAIFKNRIRSTEFFRDHDKLRSGIITRNQFIRGLTLAQDGVQLGASLLTDDEIKQVADYYTDSNGMVHYKDFCHKMENTFNIPELEKNPTLQPVRPEPKMLQTVCAKLSPQEEDRVAELISEVRQYWIDVLVSFFESS